MIENNKRPHDEMIQKDWAKTIAQHVGAWALLIGLSLWLWSMIKPIMPIFAGVASQKESSETAVSSETNNPTKTTPVTISTVKSTTTTLVKINKPVTKPAVAPNTPRTLQPAQISPTTTTTMFPPATTNTTAYPIVVNGAQVVNPLITSDSRQLKIIVNGLNVRATPGSDGAVVGAIKKNEVVKVLGYQDQWLYVETDKGLNGFIKSNPKFETPLN
jgi:cytoskeletal protein RodZ